LLLQEIVDAMNKNKIVEIQYIDNEVLTVSSTGSVAAWICGCENVFPYTYGTIKDPQIPCVSCPICERKYSIKLYRKIKFDFIKMTEIV